MKKTLLILFTLAICFGCNKATNKSAERQKEMKGVNIPVFSSDSAYHYIQRQVDFGPRVPNTKEHVACAEYLSAKLKEFGAEVTEQRADLTAFDGTTLKAVNIIGSFRPENKKRILLFAHWDSRPWADHDPNAANRKKPVLGANDGASGVGVLLEIARQINKQQPNAGVDIIFFDAEDYGAPEHLANANTANSWCLGSQYWARNPHTSNYRARYGILLDMVGAPNATFYREQISGYYANDIVDKVWKQAKNLGFNQYFINQNGGGVTDDHLYINQIIGIPSIDIIQQDRESPHGFGHYWHTINDTMEHIDKNTLQAVGTTLLYIIYNE
ncbi:glutamine cyclotransferase [Paludibacter sp. 221]|uniref:M28 family peptidase n=1 Tax=Paludibacter sp. 221 TaxID=2302939 RepID=UPI0013D57D3C|nr:M28 family peptidase [Paludibacter sp. 221]NDV46835.1 glutamine cyclotransferase [Paludibacter sp. 221]